VPLTRSPSTRSSSSSALATWLVAGFVMLGLASYCTSRLTLNNAAAQITVLEQHREELGVKMTKYEKDIRELEREILSVDALVHKQHNQDDRSNHVQDTRQRALMEMNELQQRLHSEAIQAQSLKQQVQAMSRDEIIHKYGRGVHRVELELVFPDHHRGPTRFIIELAPAEMMPHSVHTFLEMVSTGLLDGCSFILNALHVLKAAPLPYDGTSAAEKAKAFSEKGLESVSFKEYNEHYPHHKHTVGFAADGSPSFYINTDDNSAIHVGDPCFGKVVSGFDTVHRLEAQPTRNGIWFERRIGIKSARILTP
jgi:cyclophilin family peptidyl-prolyl cis-trans isomerase